MIFPLMKKMKKIYRTATDLQKMIYHQKLTKGQKQYTTNLIDKYLVTPSMKTSIPGS